MKPPLSYYMGIIVNDLGNWKQKYGLIQIEYLYDTISWDTMIYLFIKYNIIVYNNLSYDEI